MNGTVKLCGVILAAGASSRMGRDKALLPWPPVSAGAGDSGGGTLLSAAILALKPLTEAVVVVAGKNANAIAPVVGACGASLVENPAPERGQFSSLQVGLRAVLARDCNAAMIAPVDCPPLCADTLKLLRASFEQAVARDRWAVAPESRGRHGHPLVASRALIDAFLSAPVTSNARQFNRANSRLIEYVPVPDPFVSVDLNTPEEYAALLRFHNSFETKAMP
jgi:molybdenum cofactor cytidylyltransferase